MASIDPPELWTLRNPLPNLAARKAKRRVALNPKKGSIKRTLILCAASTAANEALCLLSLLLNLLLSSTRLIACNSKNSLGRLVAPLSSLASLTHAIARWRFGLLLVAPGRFPRISFKARSNATLES